MAQDSGKILPFFINTDAAYQNIKPEESPFVKGFSWDINGNPEQGIATNNPMGEGQNLYVLTPTRSNAPIPKSLMPVGGWNKNIGSYESIVTNDLIQFVYNSTGLHSIFLLDGDTGIQSKVITDPKLAFTDDQEGFIANVRCAVRYVKDKDGNIVEKHLMWTDGKKWQGWINLIAAIGSDGFDASLYPYWVLQPPHFDREELLEWPVRPPMIKPVVSVIANTAADSGKVNRIVDKAIRFAIAFENTDGRTTRLSPYSLPLAVKTEEYLNDQNNIPKNAKLVLPAGSPLTEKMLLYVSYAGSVNTLDSLSVWGDWILYDTIDRFDTPATGDYWTRTNPWSAFSYDTVQNTIEYTFDNSKVGKFVAPKDAMMIQTGMPQISQGIADVDDSVILCNNRYGYDNLTKSITDKLSSEVRNKAINACARPMRTIYLYAYIGQCYPDFSYTSQVGYTNGTDDKVRFGGLRMSFGNGTPPGASTIDFNESSFFGLDFADKKALRCYLKGTPYFADGEWCIVKSDNTITPIDTIYDFSKPDVLINVQNIFSAGSYFMCRFKLTVPAGRYIATLGRHNVESSGDYRNTSTYIYGIANSRVKSQTNIGGTGTGQQRLVTSIRPNAMVTNSKEMEIDCVNGNLDVWGNNKDLFYVYCPYNQHSGGQGRYRFIEGYFKESVGNPLPVEMFPYKSNRNNFDDWGKFTDKNGFYWGYTKSVSSESTDIMFTAKVNCAGPNNFNIPSSQTGSGWIQNGIAYLSDHTGTSSVGDCNRVLYKGRITDTTGLIGYAGIAVSILDGSTAYTDSNGDFTLYIHNGQTSLRASNVYVNAGGNYIMTIANCGQIPVSSYNEALIQCVNCNERIYPVRLNLQVIIQSTNSLTSLKDGGEYFVGCAVADLAGRISFVNKINKLSVPTFLQSGNVNATYIRLLILSALNFSSENPDFKWFLPYVSKNVNSKRYLQWSGDKLIYLDSNGNVVTDPTTAAFVKIVIDSLYKSNVSSNFTLLSSYQFAKGDRLRVYDDGDGNLFDVATYGDTIDVQVLGTNYNQAAINAGILPPAVNTVIDSTKAITDEKEIGLILKYDTRLDRLSDKTGFWVEIYTPIQSSDEIPFFEIAGAYPIINGEIATFTGYNNGVPTYTFPASIDIDFWDTYFVQRSISGKYFNHPFESLNVTDNWGANITSGGRINVENKLAAQQWFGGDIIRSDSFLTINGLAMFRDENRKDYGVYPYGEIIAAHSKRNIIAFICRNDWFTVEYNMPYTKVGQNGTLVVTNLDQNLSSPMQKIGAKFGVEKEDIGAVILDEDYFFWYDRKNTAFVKCDYRNALDVSQVIGDERGGMQSYINEKTWFINTWNASHSRADRFDVIGGIDGERGNIYLTFRPRRNNTNDPRSYVNQRRNWDEKHQETIVYSIQYKGWLPCVNYTPESYARLRGKWANVEFITFAAGIPYVHNNTENNSFLNFYGQQTEPSLISVFNKNPDASNILQAISQDANGSFMYADMIYENQVNSFSYVPANRWIEKQKTFYAEVLRDMASYPDPAPANLFRSMLFDGKRIFGGYIVARFVQNFDDLGTYFQLAGISYLTANSYTTKP